MYNVLDFAGLSDDQLREASLLIGGTAAKTLSLHWPEDGEPSLPVDEVDWTQLDTVIVDWGEPRIDAILALVRRHCLLANGFRLGLILGGMLWSCSFVARDLTKYDVRAVAPAWLLPWDGAIALGRLTAHRPSNGPVFVSVSGQDAVWLEAVGLERDG